MRAFDLLVALVSKSGEVVLKKDLVAIGWPGLHVEEGNLRVQIAKLRRALSDGGDTFRYIVNIAGKGYSFGASVHRSSSSTGPDAVLSDATAGSLPPRPHRIIGRGSEVRSIVEALSRSNLVTIVGPGGIGKTVTAVAVGYEVVAELRGAVYFVDLASISDPLLIPTALAGALGIPLPFKDPVATLAAYLATNRRLIILDNCEHLIEEVALLVEQVMTRAPDVQLLATSREALRVGHEVVYRLPTLATPPAGSEPNAAEAIAFPAVEMFVSRISDTISGYVLTDAEAPRVSEICRRLDGVALAVELVAARVGIYGMGDMDELLAEGLKQVPGRQRSGLFRHQTLEVMLDWSYALLSQVERLVYRRLGVFAGRFILADATAVVGDTALGPHRIADVVTGLAAKSLVAVGTTGDVPTFRLLHTTREHARRKLLADGENDKVARQHATHYLQKVEASIAASAAYTRGNGLSALASCSDEIRGALEWSSSEDGDGDLFLRLAAAAGALFLELSLLGECLGWTERGLRALRDAQRGGRTEMELLASFALSLLFSKGNTEEVGHALRRGIDIAHQIGDSAQETRLLGGLHIFHLRIGDYDNALLHAELAVRAGKLSGDVRTAATASWILGCAQHLTGDHLGAIRNCASALEGDFGRTADVSQFGIDHRVRALSALSRSLWLVGRADEAVLVSTRTILAARRLDHPVSLSIALIWTTPVHLWTGNLELADARISELIAHTERHAHAPYRALGVGMRGQLFARRGQYASAEQLLSASIAALEADNHRMLLPTFKGELARCLCRRGRYDEALALIDDGIAEIGSTRDLQSLPDLYSARAEILALRNHPADDWIAACDSAIESARVQSALALELRASLVLVDAQGKLGLPPSLDLIEGLLDRFQEGFRTADLLAAKSLVSA